MKLGSINTNSETLRNKIGIFLGNFSLLLSKTQLNSLIEALLKNIQTAKTLEEKIVNLIIVNLIAKVSGARHSNNLTYT